MTVHESDDEAAAAWAEDRAARPARMQRLGEENVWAMGLTGPLGTVQLRCFFDKGPSMAPTAARQPAAMSDISSSGTSSSWRSNRHEDGRIEELRGRTSIRERASSGRRGGQRRRTRCSRRTCTSRHARGGPVADRSPLGRDGAADMALRRIAEHGRAMTMLVADGVLPGNGARLAPAPRHAPRRAHRAATGAHGRPSPRGGRRDDREVRGRVPGTRETIEISSTSVLAREEAAFDRTLRAGLGLLERGARVAGGDRVTHVLGRDRVPTARYPRVPIELTEEVAARERGSPSTARASTARCAAAARARPRPRARGRRPPTTRRTSLLDAEGPSEFVGRDPGRYTSKPRASSEF